MIDIGKAILALHSEAQISVNAEDLNQIEWIDGNPTNITIEQIQAKMLELQAVYDTNEYARNREVEYPSVNDFMEAYTEKEIRGDSTKWDEYVGKYNKVRIDNPKG